MKKFKTFVLCAVIATLSILSCKQPAKNEGKTISIKVETSTPCSLLFYIEDEQVKKEVEFTVLPEPEIAKIECEPAEITLGKNYTHQLMPKLTYNPSKIGTLDAVGFVPQKR